MPSFELSKLQAATAPRALSEADRTPIDPRAASEVAGPSSSVKSDAGVSIEISARISSGVETTKPPVNQDRVAEIRDALRDGSYPLVPTQIADAMIAAQFSFEVQ